ncbi:hypothetical protein SLEP1_g46648 [Rubroshorea leprosula]|uniref:Protein kinase domain-containing protein n=1 Tax=Rubroshorea leprosula TaxID=152421 RepID=A0AAV5LNR5_9ROSI|nr:hypothetical protein SLEP1_g46648 [Rubroshorea leprosula]
MEWIRGPTIGRGATATVSLATSVPSGELLAIKSTELSRSMFLQREQHFLSNLSSPHLVKYMGCGITNEDNKSMYNLCMEYVPDGTLSDEIRQRGGRLEEETIRLYTQQIVQGLEYLHINGLAHCDIKSKNILLGKSGAKIADLGCAKLVGDVATSGFSGTPAFMAPEVARGEEQGFAADIWALGCTIIEMGTGNLPWPELNDPVPALYKIGFSGDTPEIPIWFSKKGKDFLGKCLKRDAKDRWTAKELLKHPFLEDTEPNSGEETISPNSVLDQCFWNSMEVLESPRNLINTYDSSSNSLAERIKDMTGSSSLPDWTWGEDWITVRSNGVEENREFCGSDEENLMVEDEPSIQTAFFLDSHEEEIESTMFDEDQFLEYSVENTIVFSNIMDDFVLECNGHKFSFWCDETSHLNFEQNSFWALADKFQGQTLFRGFFGSDEEDAMVEDEPWIQTAFFMGSDEVIESWNTFDEDEFLENSQHYCF